MLISIGFGFLFFFFTSISLFREVLIRVRVFPIDRFGVWLGKCGGSASAEEEEEK